MQYKTLTLQLLRQYPGVHNRLKTDRILPEVLDLWAADLKARHDERTETLSRARPGRAREPIRSEALELALGEMEDRLRAELPPDDSGPLSLDAAMVFLRGPTPPA